MVTLRQLEYLVHVVDEGTVTDAAAVLGVTQPALSHQLRALEHDLGGSLLERTPRGVRPTPLGRAVLPHARATLHDADRVRTAAARARDASAGELDVATVRSLGVAVLPAVLSAWRSDHPGVAVRVHEHRHAADALAAVTAGAVDLALAPLPDDHAGTARVVGEEELVVVVPPGHRLARRRSRTVRLEELADDPWVHYATDHGLADVLDAAAARCGFRPRAAVRTGETAAAPRYAAAGVGTALVPLNLLDAETADAALRPDPPVRRTVGVVLRTPGEPLTEAFTAVVLAHAHLGPQG